MSNLDNAIDRISLIFFTAIQNAVEKEGLTDHTKEIETVIKENGFQIMVSPAICFSNFGRGKGKMPPIENIRDWIKKHDDYGIPVSAAYPIAKKIGEEGFKGRFFLSDFKDEKIAAEKELLNAVKLDIKSIFDNFKQKK